MTFFKETWQLNKKQIFIIILLAFLASVLIIWTGKYTADKSGLVQILEANLSLPVFALAAGFLAALFPSIRNPYLRVRVKQDQWLLGRFIWLLLVSASISLLFSILGEILLAMQGQINGWLTWLLTWWLLFQTIILVQSVILLISLLMPKLSFRLVNCLVCILAWLYFMSAFSKNYWSLINGTAFTKSFTMLSSFCLLAWGSILLLWLLASLIIKRRELL